MGIRSKWVTLCLATLLVITPTRKSEAFLAAAGPIATAGGALCTGPQAIACVLIGIVGVGIYTTVRNKNQSLPEEVVVEFESQEAESLFWELVDSMTPIRGVIPHSWNPNHVRAAITIVEMGKHKELGIPEAELHAWHDLLTEDDVGRYQFFKDEDPTAVYLIGLMRTERQTIHVDLAFTNKTFRRLVKLSDLTGMQKCEAVARMFEDKASEEPEMTLLWDLRCGRNLNTGFRTAM